MTAAKIGSLQIKALLDSDSTKYMLYSDPMDGSPVAESSDVIPSIG